MDKKLIAYTIGYMDNDDIAYIGWNSEIDYYDIVFTDGLSDEEDWAFVETNPDYETVNVYRCNTKEEAEAERSAAQHEFDEKVIVIKVVKQGNWWYPDFNSDDEK